MQKVILNQLLLKDAIQSLFFTYICLSASKINNICLSAFKNTYFILKNQMCLVPECKENHPKHYCRVCQDNNSIHFSNQCPQGIVLYHGTSMTFVQPILLEGFKPSTGGCLGPGVYFASFNGAKNVATHRAGNSGAAVFRVRVNTDKCKSGIHPPWAGANFQFKEWCLSGSNYEITGVFLKNGSLSGYMKAKGIEVFLSSNADVSDATFSQAKSIQKREW